MVNVDTVYQKVLALANKEQRGYITPQEFNLLANKAQLEIFENYFHDMKTAYHKPIKNHHDAFDEIEIIQEKLHPFTSSSTPTLGTDGMVNVGGSSIYRIRSIEDENNIPIEEVSQVEIGYIMQNPLTKPTVDRKIYYRSTYSGISVINVRPVPTASVTINLSYYKKPSKPEWAYVVVNEKALYNSTLSKNFELHQSEEEMLVSIILKLAGITIMKPGIVEIGSAEINNSNAEKNN